MDELIRVSLPTFTPIADTLFLTLCGRALDDRMRTAEVCSCESPETGSPRGAGLRGPSTTHLQISAFRRVSSFASPLAPIFASAQPEADDHDIRTSVALSRAVPTSLQLAGM